MESASLSAIEGRSSAAVAASEVRTGEQAMVPTGAKAASGESPAPTPVLGRVALEMDVTVPVGDFRMRDLIGLDRGSVIEAQWNHDEDQPLSVGKVQLAWTEFDVVNTRLAVRIARLA